MSKPQPVPRKVVVAIKEIIERDMKRFGLRKVTVQAAEDHDGDPILAVDADYDLSDEPIDLDVVVKLTTKVRDRLWTMGEERFPHIRNNFPDEQKIAGYA